MRAITYSQYGTPDTLTLTDVPDPRVGPGEVLIRVRSASVNPVDWKVMGGYLDGLMQVDFPAIPGWDVSGVVEAVGLDTPEYEVGDEVIAYARKDWVQHGTFAELVAAPVRTVARKPKSLDWHQAEDPQHRGVQLLVRDLNILMRESPALYRNDCRLEGFDWLEINDAENSVFAWVRKGAKDDPLVVVAANFTPVDRTYRLGFPAPGRWTEVLNTDAEIYGGGGRGNGGGIETEATGWHNQPRSADIALPPLSVVMFRQG
jgi:hypothetical protein